MREIIILLIARIAFADVNIVTKLSLSKNITEKILDEIWKRWQIERFPNFLQSAAMTHTSWEVLKLKFQKTIIKGSAQNQKFVISFTGSSVTAGHDSPFNATFPILTEKLMGPAFDALNISLIGRNSAMGNNPW